MQAVSVVVVAAAVVIVCEVVQEKDLWGCARFMYLPGNLPLSLWVPSWESFRENYQLEQRPPFPSFHRREGLNAFEYRSFCSRVSLRFCKVKEPIRRRPNKEMPLIARKVTEVTASLCSIMEVNAHQKGGPFEGERSNVWGWFAQGTMRLKATTTREIILSLMKLDLRCLQFSSRRPPLRRNRWVASIHILPHHTQEICDMCCLPCAIMCFWSWVPLRLIVIDMYRLFD